MSERISSTSKLLLVAALGCEVLSACANSGNSVIRSDMRESTHISNAFIYNNAKIRTDPSRQEDSGDGSTNLCFQTPQAIVLPNQNGFVSEGDDDNGPWIGFELSNLPKNVQAECKRDADSIVWVVKQNVVMAPVPEAASVTASH